MRRQREYVVKGTGTINSHRARDRRSQSVKVWERPASHSLYRPADPLDTMRDEDKVALLMRVDAETRRIDPRVKQVMASLAAVHEVVLVASSDGTLTADVRPLVRINVSVIVEQNGRREQGYSGQAQWEWIAAIKQAVGIPVIGNGDIRTPEDAAAMVAETGCDAVMIGRAAPANPWIFRQIAQYTATGRYERPTMEDRYHMIRAYFEMLLVEVEATKDLPRDARMGDPAGKMKQFATWFTHGVPGGAKLRAAIYHAKTGTGVLDEVERFFTAKPMGGEGVEADESPVWPDGALVCD